MANTLISAVVCTYNRSRSLRETLECLAAQQADGFDYEVVVVDNHSTDDTKAAVASCQAAFGGRLRYVFEPRQGKPYALNTGVRAATGELIAFTDDDTKPDPSWLRSLRDTILAFDADCAYGKILPLWMGERPEWLGEYFLRRLALLDRGEEPFIVTSTGLEFYGANVAIRKEALARVGEFNVHLGNRGRRIGGEEDEDLFLRLLASGARVVYTPHAVVHHKVPPERMSPAYFWRWHFGHGMAEAYLTPCERGKGLLGIPFWAVKGLFNDLARCVGSLVGTDVEARLIAQMRLLRGLGLIVEKLKIATGRGSACSRS